MKIDSEENHFKQVFCFRKKFKWVKYACCDNETI